MHVDIISGNSPAIYRPSNTGAYLFVKVDDMNFCSIYQSNSRLYSSINKALVPECAIIFAKRGAAIATNKVRITKCPLVMDSNMMALVAKNSIDYLFLYYSILNEKLWRIADTSTIPQINNKHIKPYRIPLPPLPEQKKIAEILSAWDRAIEQVGRLIDAKQWFKKGLMQRLLTGKLRFPEFAGSEKRKVKSEKLRKEELPEGWKEVKLDEVASIAKKERLLSIHGEVLLTVKLHCLGVVRNTKRQPSLTEGGRPYFKRYSGEFLIGRQNFHNGGFGIVPEDLNEGIASNAITSLNIQENFLIAALTREHRRRPGCLHPEAPRSAVGSSGLF